MKKYIFIATAALLLSACNQDKLDRAEQEKERQKDSLLSIVNEREASINDFIASFNEVESNLDSIRAKQHLINVNTEQKGDLKQSQKDRINTDIIAINKLMEENRNKLAELKRKLKNSANKNTELEKAIETINNQLAQKDVELTALNEKLNNLNAQVTELQTSLNIVTEESNSKSEEITEKTIALHTAYYVVGKSKELRDAKLIDNKGGLLGMGKTPELNSDIDNNKFTRIDYTKTTSITVESNIKIITTHPSDSYTLNMDTKNKNVESIEITNPEKFWSASKYLVVVKK